MNTVKKPNSSASSAADCKIKNLHSAGMTLVEVMVAVTVLMIAILGVSSAYVSGRKQIIKQQYYRSAVDLTSQKLEEIKAAGYNAIAAGQQEEELELYDLTCQRNTLIELTATPSSALPKPCKKVTVTTEWNDSSGGQHEIKLATYVGP